MSSADRLMCTNSNHMHEGNAEKTEESETYFVVACKI